MSVARTFGGLLVLQDRFDPRAPVPHRAVSNHLPLHGADDVRAPAAPAVEIRERYDTSSLTNISHTAAPCPPDVKRALIEWLGPIITEFYGSTRSASSPAAIARNGSPILARSEGRWPRVRSRSWATMSASGGRDRRGVRSSQGMPDFTYQGKSEARAEIEREG